jgi:hypothetical protein
MFIDQNSRDLRKELDALPHILESASVHCVLEGPALTRSWCCYEIALFNRRCATGQDTVLRSLIAPSRAIYFGWEYTETSEPEDKAFIAERIASDFPEGFEGFSKVMNQANASAVLQLTEGSVTQMPLVFEGLADAAQQWYSRMQSGRA